MLPPRWRIIFCCVDGGLELGGAVLVLEIESALPAQQQKTPRIKGAIGLVLQQGRGALTRSSGRSSALDASGSSIAAPGSRSEAAPLWRGQPQARHISAVAWLRGMKNPVTQESYSTTESTGMAKNMIRFQD